MMKYWCIVFFSVLASLPAHADDPFATLNRVEHYLNATDTMQTRFRQIAPDGEEATGILSIKQPGKMRWEYDPPTPILMVSNGDTLVYYDSELDQISYLELEDTIAGILAQETIRFDDDALRVIDVREGAGSIRLTLLQTDKIDEGSLTLVLNTEPMLLTTLMVTDASRQVTMIELNNLKRNITLDDDLFVFKNPRGNRLREYRR